MEKKEKNSRGGGAHERRHGRRRQAASWTGDHPSLAATPPCNPATLQPCGGVSEMYASAMQLGSYIETSLGQLWERIVKWLAVGFIVVLSLQC
jgi:hypothetical protein